MILRPDQQALVASVRASLRTHQSVLMQAPTGFGKTCVITHMLQNVHAKGKRAIFTVHRQELLDQTVATFKRFSLPHGIIAAGYTPHLMEPIQVASIDTLRSRITSGRVIPACDLFAIDEGHHAVSRSWRLVRDYFPNAKVVLASATPERLDGKGLRSVCEDMVCGPTVASLIEAGHLSRYRAFAPSTPDTSGLHTKMGDYVKGEVAELMDRPKLTGDAVQHYLRLARGKRAIVFCISVEHSKHVVEQFKSAGVLAWHIDGTTDRGERRQSAAAFARGEIQVLSNVELISEGYDCPDAEVCIMLRPTKSLAMYLQQVGRVLRPAQGKTALLLDHAGNIARHGLPDDPREWSLDGRDKRDRKQDEAAAMAVRQCPKCYHCHRPADKCPACGWSYEAKARQVDEVDGTLEEIDLEAQRRERKAEQGRADTIEALIQLGRQRGYKSPERWAAHLWTARLAKKGRA